MAPVLSRRGLAAAAAAALWGRQFCEGFVAPVPAAQARAAAVRVAAAGRGFGSREERGRLRKTDTPPRPQADQDGSQTQLSRWERQYKAYIKRTGKYLCSMSWEGYKKMGRGAVFANYEDAEAKGELNEADRLGGVPSMFVPLDKFGEMYKFEGMAPGPGEEDELAHITDRIQSYNPEREFVVVFQAAGLMGADIVKPNITPPEMAKIVVPSDEGAFGTGQGVPDADGVIDVTPTTSGT